MKVDELLGLIEDEDDSEEQTRKDELVEQDVHDDEQIQQETKINSCYTGFLQLWYEKWARLSKSQLE